MLDFYDMITLNIVGLLTQHNKLFKYSTCALGIFLYFELGILKWKQNKEFLEHWIHQTDRNVF